MSAKTEANARLIAAAPELFEAAAALIYTGICPATIEALENAVFKAEGRP